MNSKNNIITLMFAIAAIGVFTSCEKDVDEVEVTVVNDCPDLALNIGETCQTASGNALGVVSEDCICVVADPTDFDCPDLQANIGDVCSTPIGAGIVDQNCECFIDPVVLDCPGLGGNIGDPCQGGWGVITVDCDCIENPNVYDCPDVQANIGDACTVEQGGAILNGILDADCNCNVNDPTVWDCPTIESNIGDQCFLDPAGTMTGVVDENCNCIDDTPDWDCPDLLLNYGDPCWLIGNVLGTVNQSCECEE